MLRVPAVLKPIASILHQAGYCCYLVGGAVRDMLCGRRVTDLDLATDATPQTVMKLFRRVIPTGIEHGTVTILFKGRQYEITTFRSDGDYGDGRHPQRVDFTRSIVEDLGRRDFTVNGMALEVREKRLIDPFDGRGDIRRRLIRAIGDPEQRFSEDSLRLMRAVRFAVQLEFSIDATTHAAIRRHSDGIRRVSAERIRDELSKMLVERDAAGGLRIMRETQLLRHLLPELLEGIGVPQDSQAAPDVFEHLLLTLNGADPQRLDMRWAALLHDVAKPRCVQSDSAGALHFYGHDTLSAEMASAILVRLRYPRRLTEHVAHLIRHHMFDYSSTWNDAAVRRFVARVGPHAVDDLLLLRAADSYGKSGRRRADPAINELRRRVAAVVQQEQALSIRDLAVNGNDLQREIGIPSGRDMGTVLRFLLESVLDDPAQNERQRLLTIAERFYRERIAGPRQR
ncbi:MAG: HD domain-containing protein [Spirochaetaceae bacterium]|nr:MAG: HD domain-containing protein [Spirochaetaceae bacterium]